MFELGVVPLPVDGGIGASVSLCSLEELSFVPRPTPRPIAKPMTITAAQQTAIILHREQVLFPFISVEVYRRVSRAITVRRDIELDWMSDMVCKSQVYLNDVFRTGDRETKPSPKFNRRNALLLKSQLSKTKANLFSDTSTVVAWGSVTMAEITDCAL